MGIISGFTQWLRNLVSSEPSPDEKMGRIQEEYEDSLSEIREGIADVTTHMKKLELRKSKLENKVAEQKDSAKEAVKEDEKKARKILERRVRNEDRLERLAGRIDELESIRRNLIDKKEKMSDELSRIRMMRTDMKAKRKAAEVRSRVSDTLSDTSGMDVEESLKEMQREVERLESRAEVYSTTGQTSEPKVDSTVSKNIDENIEKELEEIKQES
jgi:phage shock protein A